MNETRHYTSYATDALQRDLLSQLLENSGVDHYRNTMHQLGSELARALSPRLTLDQETSLRVICTVEDADFLAAGFIEYLESHLNLVPNQVQLSCLWNERFYKDNISLSPIVKSYIEPNHFANTVFVVLKSIISGACVVRTNLLDAISREQPNTIFIVAPVIYKGAEQRLAKEFPDTISSKFNFIYFAEDNTRKPDGEVIPGVGGMVYPLLGLGETSRKKNDYVPKLVQLRRKTYFPLSKP